ncbi:MAG: restriction endonuclease [Pseudomonadota bacterium]
MKLDDLIKDWGGFERLVAELHETGDVTVERDVVLTGQSGAPRQIDVVLRQRGSFYDHLILVECKYWKRRVRREQVDALSSAVRDLRAAKGVIFSTKGFQAGAVTQAAADGIELIAIRELRKHEWGLPGRIIDLFLHIVQIGAPKVSFPGAQFFPRAEGAGPPAVALHFDGDRAESVTQLRNMRGEPTGETLEQLVLGNVNRVVREAMEEVGIFNDEKDGDYYVMCPGILTFDTPIIFAVPTGVVVAPTIKMENPVKISQSRLSFDRADHLTFALAIESKVTGLVSTASRHPDAQQTVVHPVRDAASKPDEPAFENGSVARLFLKGFFDVSEIEKMTPIALAEVSRPRRYIDPAGD